MKSPGEDRGTESSRETCDWRRYDTVTQGSAAGLSDQHERLPLPIMEVGADPSCAISRPRRRHPNRRGRCLPAGGELVAGVPEVMQVEPDREAGFCDCLGPAGCP